MTNHYYENNDSEQTHYIKYWNNLTFLSYKFNSKKFEIFIMFVFTSPILIMSKIWVNLDIT